MPPVFFNRILETISTVPKTGGPKFSIPIESFLQSTERDDDVNKNKIYIEKRKYIYHILHSKAEVELRTALIAH